MDKQLRTNRTITISTAQARAIGHPIRSKILSMLYSQMLTTEEIRVAINKAGFKKGHPTVRHHIRLLREADLIEVARVDESRGGVKKYYGTSIRLLNFEMPQDSESTYLPVIDKMAEKLEGVLDGVIPDIAASGTKPATAERSAYLAVEIMNRAITRVLEKERTLGISKTSKSRTSTARTRRSTKKSDGNNSGNRRRKSASTSGSG